MENLLGATKNKIFGWKCVMRDAEVSRSRTCLLLKNKKKNTFVSENNRFLESTKRKGSRIYKTKSEFLLMSIMLEKRLQT